ncbi:hypothetical protein OPT61_g2929 [Boeremia exigua]|uniref:Uncharacterized protein n=1 Tax=Boeremia exigua TaxID=749465 RepID=A0ACC2IJU9_9PLEO|nr:hypothetical protein OPT61_g2929 [Boeremia exigua]
MRGKHTGVSMAQQVLQVLQATQTTKRLLGITCDNASNNSALSQTLQLQLQQEGVVWRSKENTIPCLAHIINLVVQDIIRHLRLEASPETENAERLQRQHIRGIEAQMSVPNSLRKLRAICIAIDLSPQRFERFLAIQCDLPVNKRLSVIRDVRTRWNSTHDMCERALKLQVYIDKWLEQEIALKTTSWGDSTSTGSEVAEADYKDLKKLRLAATEWQHLRAITQMLQRFKKATSALSETQKPHIQNIWLMYNTLFDFLDKMLEELGDNLNNSDNSDWPEVVRSAASKGRAKLSKYYARTGDEQGYLYNCAAILDPTQKLTVYEDETWDVQDKHTYRDQFLAYLDRYDEDNGRSRSATQALYLSIQQSVEDEWFRRPASTMRSMSSSFSAQSQSSPALDGVEELPPTREEGEAYLSTPCVRSYAGFNILDWWKANAATYPRLASVARDILAVPITEVGVERVFNTAKDIIGDRRHRLSAQRIRQIMILKDSISHDEQEEEDELPIDEVDDLLELPACPSPEPEVIEEEVTDFERGTTEEVELAIPPFIIFKARYHLTGWYKEEDLPQDWVIGVSSNGWTTNELGFEWLKHFDRHTKERTVSTYRLLVIDGYKSHDLLQFQQYCKDNKIGGFRGAGLAPFDPERVIMALDVKLRTPSPQLPTNNEPWQSQTPSNTLESGSQSTLIREKYKKQQGSSPNSVLSALEHYAKGGAILSHKLVLAQQEIKELRAANEAATRRKSHKRKRVQKEGTLIVEDGQRLAALKEFGARGDGKRAKKQVRAQEEELTAWHIPPTREMIQNFASSVAKERVSESWVTRFINNYSINLISQYSTGMDADRHNADSYAKYELYFNLLQRKIAEYKVDAEHTYNIDEKGFMIGVTIRTKHVFSRRMWEKGEVKASLQDSNRAWITLLACVCGDGSALPPGLLYESANSTIQSSWVEEIQPEVHSVFVSSSPTGWTNNNIGLAWLQQVFDRFTKAKARRKWRLLILDSYGSHITMDFINYCNQNKILLAILPPHSTHTLQPLDVVMFKPLLTAYSKELTTHLHNSQGLSVIKKSDFFHLFWKAWTSTFTQGLILKSFEATGIAPLQPNVILQRFAKPSPQASDRSRSSSSTYSGEDWLKIETLLCRVAKDESSKELRKVSRSLHYISIQNQLLHHEIAGLKEYKQVKQQEAEAEEARKAEMAELRRANKLYKEQVAQERRKQRTREKEERDQVKAKKAEEVAERKAERERQKQARDAQEALQLSQRGSKNTSKASIVKKKPARRGVGARSRPKPATPPPPARTHTTRSGRTATLYK